MRRIMGYGVVGCWLLMVVPGWSLSVWINGAGTRYDSIQQGVDAADNGEWLAISTGVYYEAVMVSNKNVGLRGGFSENNTNFIGGYTAIHGGGASRPLYYFSSTGRVEELFIIHGNAADWGAGIRLVNSAVTLANVNIMSNAALAGGGLYVDESSRVWLTNRVWVMTNSAYQAGGALVRGELWADHPDVHIANNDAIDTGGGVYLWWGQAHIAQGKIAYNRARGSAGNGGSGGGVSIYRGHLVVGDECSIIGNSGLLGGGIYVQEGTVTLHQAQLEPLISDNTAFYGAGLFMTNYSLANLDGAIFARNQAFFRGGGICAYRSTITNQNAFLSRSRFSNNQAGYGAGIYLEESVACLHNLILGLPEEPNDALHMGGGMCLLDSQAELRGGIVQCNVATSTIASCGGGIAAIRSRMVLTNSFDYPQLDIISNKASETASGLGGGVYFEELLMPAQLSHVTLAGNRAGSGGGLYATNSGCDAIDLVANHNSALMGHGGGIVSYGSRNVFSELALNGNYSGMDGGGMALLNPMIARIAGGTNLDLTESAYCIQSNRCVNWGGGIYVSGGGVEVANLVFQTNSCLNGGGGLALAFSTNALCVVSNVLFENNYTAQRGAGVHAWHSTVDFFDVNLDNNTAGMEGGGIYAGGSNYPIRVLALGCSCSIVQNTAGERGGGVFHNSHGEMMLAGVGDNTFHMQMNQAGDDGGGLYLNMGRLACSGLVHFSVNYSATNGGAIAMNRATTLEMQRSEPDVCPAFTLNLAAGGGGAVYANVGSTCVVDQALFMLNRAYLDGGAVAFHGQLLWVNQGEFVDNSADQNGGALYAKNAGLILFNQHSAPWPTSGHWPLVFELNQAQLDGGAIYLDGCPDARFYRTVIRSNSVATGNGGGIFAQGSKVDCKLALLADNDAQTVSMADGVSLNSSTGYVRQSTVVNNDSVGLVENDSRLTLIESIVWGHAGQQIVGVNATATWCCIQNGWANSSEGITNHPRLYAGYYHLQYDSPCINAGDIAPYDTDIDNEGRFVRTDIGFDEFTDSDHDKLPDTVETGTGGWLSEINTGTQSTNADSDGDTLLDGDEWIADTDPNDAQSRLQLAGMEEFGGGMLLYQVGGTNAHLRLSAAADLAGTNWIPIETRIAPTSRTNSFLVITNAPMQYWRVEAFH